MTSLPSISIITPSLNHGQYIQDTIDSVLGQAYPNFEYTVFDGGSSDNTLDILASYDERLNWVSAPDDGQAAAINLGWQGSSGEIVAWLNADDYYLDGVLQIVAAYFRDHPHIDVLYGMCDFVGEGGQLIGHYDTGPFDYFRLLSGAINFIPQPTVFIRRRVLEELGFLNERLHYVFDYEYWLQIGLLHRIAFFPKKLAVMRLHEKAKSIAGLSALSAELVEMYQAFFARQDLSSAIKNIKRKSLAQVYLRAADGAFWAGEIGMARKYLLTAVKYGNWRPQKLWLWLLFGKLGSSWAKNYQSNPYTVRWISEKNRPAL